MSDMQRLYKIKKMIHQQGYVPKQDFLDELEISVATFKRDLDYLRDRMNYPIVYDRYHGGYGFDKSVKDAGKEIPGLWFSESEATALALMEHLLASLDKSGLLGPHIEPLRHVIDSILGPETPAKELRKRIKVLGMFNRRSSLDCFGDVGHALLKRQRINITYYSKGKDETTEREISPQRLIFYRDNWYLDAYCHLRNDLRSFAVDGIRAVEILEKSKAMEVPATQLQEFFTESYGIFSGKAKDRAKLKFSPQRARWVSTESWHPEQKGTTLADGSYVLEFPFNQDPELIMDILKHGSEVEVLEPKDLRKKVVQEIKKTLTLY
jgi:predicted DNA-binding transcriptional regulator YafY